MVTGGGSVGTPYIVPDNKPLYTKDADLIWIKRHTEIDPKFLYSFFISPIFKSYIRSISHVGTIAHYTIEQVKETPLLIPCSIVEQKAIGSFLGNLDDLITLHQRERRKAPFSRSFAWEQRKLGDEFAFLKNNTLSRAELSDSEGAVRNIHYGDILTKFGSVLDGAHVGIPRIMNEETARSLTNDQLRDGDIIVADTAEDEAVGKCTELRELGINKIVSGLHTIPLRPYSRYAPGFLGHYLNSDAYHCQLKPLMQGIKVISISRTALAETQLTVPSFDEQRQIGGYFSNLDALITLHQREPQFTNMGYMRVERALMTMSMSLFSSS